MDYHWLDHSTAQHEILYGKKIKEYAEEAYRIDSLLDLSSIAKALYYMNEKDYENAIFYLQHALEYNPNSYLAISNLYILHTYTKNREETIKHALKIINSGLPSDNSDTELSLERIYTWLAQSYRFLGFFKEALCYYDEAIRTNEDYLGSSIYKSQCILHSDEEDKYQKSIKILKDVIKKDPTSAYAYSRLGQSYYLIRDYSNAYRNYNKSFELKGKSATDHFGLNAGRLAVVYREMDEPEKAQILINNYREFGESRNLATRSFRLTGYYSFINDTTNTLKELRKASEYYQNYNRISQLRDEPIYDNMRELSEFQELFSKMQTRWETRRDSIRVVFEEKDYL
jgi:tetratricopeptide (TPR) repeat protein